ncbi:MAG: serine/threonine-protein kinase [Myxococcota bacterium]
MSSQEIADLSGRVLRGRYQATRKVGAGSMGDVYEGVDLASTGRVAIKVLKPERAVREVFRHRFLREAKSAVLIDHPNVVDVLDYGETEDGLLFIAMEFLEGEDLSSFLERAGRLQWPHCVGVLQQVAAALAAAHDRGVVHRDVKPSNILLRQAGSSGLIVKLVDFGVAKLDNHMVSRVLTKAADVVGTVLYMSPEQAEGRRADLRSDVYAFGVTAYQMVTGQVPFPGRDLFKVMSAHMGEPPPDPRAHAPEVPPWASAFILRCLEKQPDTRYQSMHDVLAVLSGNASPDMPSTARPGTPIASADDAVNDQHPPLAASQPIALESIPLDPHAPTMAGGSELLMPAPNDDFDDEAPTTYFQSPAASPNPPAAAPLESLAPPPPAPPSPLATQPMPATGGPSPFAPASPPRLHTERAAPFVAFDEDVAPYEGRTPGTVYILLAIGVLVVIAGLIIVVAA